MNSQLLIEMRQDGAGFLNPTDFDEAQQKSRKAQREDGASCSDRQDDLGMRL
jgi:hypothetical protein